MACPSRAVKANHKPHGETQPWRTLKESVELTLIDLNTTMRIFLEFILYKKEIRISKRRAWANFCSRVVAAF